MIVAVVKDGALLLAHAARFPEGMYSVLAGFVEVGESFEQCVAREVEEEAGIKVKNIRYFGSQPWPFPDSLMVGFTAEHAGGTLKVDGDELISAGWFLPGRLPEKLPNSHSIANRLIGWFLENH